MGLRIGILVFPNVQQLDLTGPYEVFASTPDADIRLIWKNLEPVRSSTGLLFTPDTIFEDCSNLDVLCVPGGGGINELLEDEAVLEFLRRQARDTRYVTSVCTGALVLGAAGLLRGRRATTHWNAFDFLEGFGAIATRERVVRDGKLITAGGVTAGIDFGLTVVAELLGRAEAESIQLALEYAPAPPFQAGTPEEAGTEILAATKKRLARSRAARETIIGRLRSSDPSSRNR